MISLDMIRVGSVFDYMRLKGFEKCLIFTEKRNFKKKKWAVAVAVAIEQKKFDEKIL